LHYSYRKLGKEPILRAWKNIRFNILDKLSEKGLINDSKGRRSIIITEEGVKKAEALKKKFFDE